MKQANRRRMIQASLAACTGVAAAPTEPIAATQYGRVRGASVDGVSVFRGIPYGSPTSRFMPPAAPQKWAGVRDAIVPGHRCVQNPGNLWRSAIGDYFSGGHKEKLMLDQETDSEDCLALNVLTPSLRGKRPVLVYIHGGGFTAMSGIITLGGDGLVREQDVVLVGINERVNVFGYLYLGGFSDRFADSGNAGLLDLVLALEWVRDNITNFGGDPGKVTIFGESGGGAKISALMAMPRAKGLFHRAIIESGSVLRINTKETATETAAAVLKKLDIPERKVEDLQNVPAVALFQAGGSQFRAGPVLDGRSFTQQTWDPAAPAVSSHVPVIIGTCREETAWSIGNGDPSTFELTDAQLPVRLEQQLRFSPEDVAQLIAIYRKSAPSATPSDLFFRITSDRGTRMTAITQAERKAQQRGASAYMYYFTYNTPMFDGKFRAFHTAELPLVFRMVRYPNSETLSKQLAGAWAAFARSGDPNHPGLPIWPAYSLDNRSTMVFGEISKSADNPDGAAREKFRSVADRPRA